MLSVLTSELLDRLAREDGTEGSDPQLDPAWKTYTDLPAAVNAAAIPGRRASAAIACTAALGLVLPILTIGLVQSSDLPIAARMVLPAIALIVPFFALYIAAAAAAAIDRTTGLEATSRSLSAYFEGGSPFSGKRVVIGSDCLFLVSREGVVSRISLKQVSAVGLDIRQSGALVVVAIGDRFLPLSLVGRAGGPMPSRWSVEGFLGIGKFRSAVMADLERVGVPFALADWSGRF